MTIPTTDKLQRPNEKSRIGQPELARMRTPAAPGFDTIQELRAIRQLLERQQKPFTVQYLGRFIGRFSIPSGQATMILDHDDDRVAVFFVLDDSAAGNVRLIHDQASLVTGFVDGFKMFNNITAPYVLTMNPAPTNRVFAVSDSGTPVLYVWGTFVDRMPVGTR